MGETLSPNTWQLQHRPQRRVVIRNAGVIAGSMRPFVAIFVNILFRKKGYHFILCRIRMT